MGLVHGVYDAKAEGFLPGGASLHNSVGARPGRRHLREGQHGRAGAAEDRRHAGVHVRDPLARSGRPPTRWKRARSTPTTHAAGTASARHDDSLSGNDAMNAPDAAFRFGSGRAVRRIEDGALCRPGPLRRQPPRVAGHATFASCARRTRMRTSSRSTPRRRARCPACSRPHRRRPGRGRRQADAGRRRLQARRRPPLPARRAARWPTSSRASSASRSSRSSPRSREAARDARRCDRRRLRGAPGRRATSTPRARAGRAGVCAGAPDNIAAEMRHGDAAATEAAFARAAPHDRARPRQPAHRAGDDGAAQRRRSFDAASGRLTVRISNQMPTGVARRRSPGAARPRAGARPRPGRRRRRRLRHEDRHPSGRHRRRATPRATLEPRRCAGRPIAARSSSRPTPGRDVTSHAELALDADGKVLALRVQSLANLGAYATPARRRHPAADRPVGLDQHLRHRAPSTCTSSPC